jgi:3'-phosphoadenosine 5'-phosphosulfate sulfotransferase (PAPS reductase)/FAD synthetase
MIKIVVPVSGGKDSQACLQLALQDYDKSSVIGLFCDTGFEHPITYDHIAWMGEFYDVKIHRINDGDVPSKIRKYKMFPVGGARHCTDELKIKPSKLFYKKMAEDQGGFEVWLGMRSNESSARKKRFFHIADNELYLPHEVLAKYPKYLGKLGVRFRLPVIDWTTEEIMRYLKGHENKLYSYGFDRVGCFPCLASGDRNKSKAFSFDQTGRKHFAIVQEIERDIKKSVWLSEIGKNKHSQIQKEMDFCGCSFCAI